ncbi:MAG: hypothetical protein ACLRYY_10400 [Anaerobutyricum soehngenii]
MKQVYLDNAATTPVRLEVEVAMRPYFCEEIRESFWSLSNVLRESSAGARKRSANRLAKTLKASAEEIYFTSGRDGVRQLGDKSSSTNVKRKRTAYHHK